MGHLLEKGSVGAQMFKRSWLGYAETLKIHFN